MMWMIWMGLMVLAFFAGVSIGVMVTLPKKWVPGHDHNM